MEKGLIFEQKARLPRTRTSFDTGLRYYSLGGELKNFSNREKRKKFLVWGLRKLAKLFMMEKKKSQEGCRSLVERARLESV